MSKTFLLSNETWKQNEEDYVNHLKRRSGGRRVGFVAQDSNPHLPKPVLPQTCDANVAKESKMERIAKIEG